MTVLFLVFLVFLLLLLMPLMLLLLLLLLSLWAAAAECHNLKLVTNRLAGDAVVVAVGLSRNVAAKANPKMAGNAERVVAVVVVALRAGLFHTVSTNLNSS
jgi:hypothetical protein